MTKNLEKNVFSKDFFSKDFFSKDFFKIFLKRFFENTYFYLNNNYIPELPSYHNLLWYLNIIVFEHIIRREHLFLTQLKVSQNYWYI